jgi:hypothetical protein
MLNAAHEPTDTAEPRSGSTTSTKHLVSLVLTFSPVDLSFSATVEQTKGLRQFLVCVFTRISIDQQRVRQPVPRLEKELMRGTEPA